jgi:transcriptional regulator with XRE-family HTH domain
MSSVKVWALNEHSLSPEDRAIVPAPDSPNNPGMAKERALARKALQALGERVEQLRKQKGWTRTTLARRAEVTVATIRGCEQGSKVTQPEKLRAIARALGVTPNRLDVDDKDPRVKQWTDEDYEVGNWYHNAPRAMKNQIWGWLEASATGHPFNDPLFMEIVTGWNTLTQDQRIMIVNLYGFLRSSGRSDLPQGGVVNVDPAAHPDLRKPQR